MAIGRREKLKQPIEDRSYEKAGNIRVGGYEASPDSLLFERNPRPWA